MYDSFLAWPAIKHYESDHMLVSASIFLRCVLAWLGIPLRPSNLYHLFVSISIFLRLVLNWLGIPLGPSNLYHLFGSIPSSLSFVEEAFTCLVESDRTARLVQDLHSANYQTQTFHQVSQ